MRMMRQGIFTLLFALLFFPCIASAQVVRAIEFDGNQRVPEETVLATIKSRPGTHIDRAQIRDDLKSLYSLGQFSDINVDTARQGDGVKLIFIFVEKPLITDVDFQGNRKIKDDKLNEAIDIPRYQPLDEQKLAESIKKIKDLYSEKGYYLTEINHHFMTGSTGDTKLVIDIEENEKAYIKKIQFIGNNVYSDQKLRDIIKTRSKGFFSFLTKSGTYKEEEMRIDVMRLAYHYMNSGYFRVRVTPPKISITKDKRYIYVIFDINEGKKYKFGDIDINGDILTTKEELLKMISSKQGEIYNRSKVDADLLKLTERYGDQGYAFANVIPQHIPDDENLTVDLSYNIERGDKITVERINISGNTTTRDKVIRRELELKENDRYSLRSIRRSREKLEALGYFSEINLATPRGSRDDTVDLNISVTDKPTRSFSLSAGFSSLESFIFGAQVSIQNFMGYGVGGALSAHLSKKLQNFSFNAQDDYFLDSQWMLSGSVYNSTDYLSDYYSEKRLGGSISLGHRFFDHWSAYLGYRIEQNAITNFSYAVPQILRQDNKGLTSALTLNVQYDTRNNRLFPTKGLLASVKNEISGNKLGGNSDFYRVEGSAQFYYPIIGPLTFRQFAKTGYIKSLNSRPVPLYERYFLGGPYSLRGYDWRSVGPRIRIPISPGGPEDEFTYGGDKQVLFVSELEWLVLPKAGIALAAFFDAGNAFAEEQNFSITNLKADIGFGIRWNSPMAPLRFEWGFPLIKRRDDDAYEFNFSMGSYF